MSTPDPASEPGGESAYDKKITLRYAWRQLRKSKRVSDLLHVPFFFLYALGNLLRKHFLGRALITLLSSILYYPISFISPKFHFDIKKTLAGGTLSLFLTSFTAGLIVSLIPAYFSYESHTLFYQPDHPYLGVYLSDDYKNLFIYLVLSPLYLAFSAMIMITAARGWRLFPVQAIDPTDNPANLPNETSLRRRIILGAWRIIRLWNYTLILLSAALCFAAVWINVRQYHSMMDPAKPLYWIADLRSNVRQLNSAGVAYFAINTMKLLFIMSAAAVFLASGLELVLVALRLPWPLPAEPDVLRKKLKHYAIIELSAKSLVLTGIVHAAVFKQQEWASTNILFELLALIIIGGLLVHLPRAWFEFAWFVHERKSKGWKKCPDATQGEIHGWQLLASTVFWGFTVILIGLGIEPDLLENLFHWIQGR